MTDDTALVGRVAEAIRERYNEGRTITDMARAALAIIPTPAPRDPLTPMERALLAEWCVDGQGGEAEWAENRRHSVWKLLKATAGGLIDPPWAIRLRDAVGEYIRWDIPGPYPSDLEFLAAVDRHIASEDMGASSEGLYRAYLAAVDATGNDGGETGGPHATGRDNRAPDSIGARQEADSASNSPPSPPPPAAGRARKIVSEVSAEQFRALCKAVQDIAGVLMVRDSHWDGGTCHIIAAATHEHIAELLAIAIPPPAAEDAT